MGKRHKNLKWYLSAAQQLQGAQAEAPEGEHGRTTTTSDTPLQQQQEEVHQGVEE